MNPRKGSSGGPPLKKHPGRPDLTGEHPFGDTGQLMLVFLFLAVWTIDSFIWPFSVFLNEYIPWVIRVIAGTLLAFPAFILVRNGQIIVFGTLRDEPMVFKEGVFSVVRHPIYSGALMFYLALILYSVSLASLAVWIGVIAFYRHIAGYEEQALVSEFGDAYRKYQDKVPMLFPGWKGFLHILKLGQ